MAAVAVRRRLVHIHIITGTSVAWRAYVGTSISNPRGQQPISPPSGYVRNYGTGDIAAGTSVAAASARAVPGG